MRSIGGALIRYVVSSEEEIVPRHTQREDYARTRGEGSHLSTRERPQKEPALVTPGSQAFSFQECERICFG